MAGHLASYFGIPVISLFGSQNPSLTKPKNKYGKIIKPKTICKHDRDHWRLCKLCIESIPPRIVYEKTIEHILYIESIL
jgi:ADP-heptose:LPS heptosyltransferase